MQSDAVASQSCGLAGTGRLHLRPLVGGKVNADLIDRNWADILRVASTMAAGTMRPSQTY